jgi:hypothetical protein
MDKEFNKIEGLVGLLETNTTAAREHVGEIEREIRLIKERTRCVTTGFPYHWIPKMVLIHTVYDVCMWLNQFSPNTELVGGLSPRELVSGRQLACDKDCCADMGAYIEATVDADITNGEEERTQSCISLGPSGNMQGSLKCFDLKTGKVVIRRRVEQLPFPNRMLKKVIEWEKKGKAQITKDSIQFLNRLGKQFEWDNDEVEDLQVVMNEPEKVQRDHGVPAEIPGIKIEDDYKAVPGPAVEHELEKESVDVRKGALAARANSGLNVVDTPLVTTRGVNSHGINDDAPVINLTRDYPLLPEKNVQEYEAANGQ